jgi:2-polyprenyl-3-methyl-5-hydroxy-6-metoxy-1,4-benzoquinol methylase
MIPEGLSEAEVDFIIDAGNVNDGCTVLDVMCGYGRHSFELARRGIQVTAVDNLPDYIEEIKNLAAKENLHINAVLDDVTQMKIESKFHVCICMGDSLSFFDEADVRKLLSNISDALLPGGKLIINSSAVSEIIIKNFTEKSWDYIDGYKYLMDNKYLFNPARIETDHIMIAPTGETETRKGIDYIFSFSELENLLKQTGFNIIDIYSTPRKKKFKFGDNRSYILAEKRR